MHLSGRLRLIKINSDDKDFEFPSYALTAKNAQFFNNNHLNHTNINRQTLGRESGVNVHYKPNLERERDNIRI